MEIHLYDTLTKKKKVLSPMDGKCYRFYCCGPTVYGPAHIGNFRTFLLQDLLRRLIETLGIETYHVRNITDVDDKTIKGSLQKKQTLKAFTQNWEKIFHADCQTLNLLPPHTEPRATEHIPEQINMIQALIEKKYAYVAQDGSVYYKIQSFPSYGKLTHLHLNQLQTQQHSSSGNTNIADEYEREQIADFALWKAWKKEDEGNFWESPWGKGRPGWHIECSAMSHKYLGNTFDLHAGGIDLCFPHHENEIAQSEAYTQTPMCSHWFHSTHLLVEGKKMSKSLGNLYTLEMIQNEGHSPMALRYLLISAHYKKPLNFTFDALNAAKSALEKLLHFLHFLLNHLHPTPQLHSLFSCTTHTNPNWGSFKPVAQALCDDLNTATALGQLFSIIKQLEKQKLNPSNAKDQLNAFLKILYILGLNLSSLQTQTPHTHPPESIQELATNRWNAKQNKDFETADKLRALIEKKGWLVIDHKNSFTLAPQHTQNQH